MRDKKHYLRLLAQNPNAGVGFALAAAAVFAARHGTCEPADHYTNEWKTIARKLKAKYGENLTTDEVRVEMDAPQDETRSDQLAPARISPSEHAEIDAARSLVGESESEFVRNAALERAREINR